MKPLIYKILGWIVIILSFILLYKNMTLGTNSDYNFLLALIGCLLGLFLWNSADIEKLKEKGVLK